MAIPRTPDIIVTPDIGVTYSGSTKKLAEHGGFSRDDTNVILLVSNPSFRARDGHHARCRLRRSARRFSRRWDWIQTSYRECNSNTPSYCRLSSSALTTTISS